MSRKVGTAPTVKRELLDLSDEEFAAVSSEIEPIVPRYDLYGERSDWLNQKGTELIVGGWYSEPERMVRNASQRGAPHPEDRRRGEGGKRGTMRECLGGWRAGKNTKQA